MYSSGPPHMAKLKQDDLLEHTYSRYVRIRDVALKTCRRRWTIGKSGERGSGISVVAARHDDDNDIWCNYMPQMNLCGAVTDPKWVYIVQSMNIFGVVTGPMWIYVVHSLALNEYLQCSHEPWLKICGVGMNPKWMFVKLSPKRQSVVLSAPPRVDL